MSQYELFYDNEIKFDLQKKQIGLCGGEDEVTNQDYVEDFKGNPNERGVLVVTNLRCIWYSYSNQNINLSIGMNPILNIDIKSDKNQILGTEYTIFIKAKHLKNKFEFIFKTKKGESCKIFSLFQQTHRSYQQTKIYRELKKGAIIQDKTLQLLQGESIISKYGYIQNVGQELGIYGTLFLTNVRIAWFSEKNENFNISIPWIQIKQILKKQLKQGLSFIIETFELSGGYSIGYMTDQIDTLFQEAQKLNQYYKLNPVLGVQKIVEDYEQSYKSKLIKRQADNVEIIDSLYNDKASLVQNKYAALSDQQRLELSNEISYESKLGLAIEKLPQGIQIEDLWRIINVNNNT